MKQIFSLSTLILLATVSCKRDKNETALPGIKQPVISSVNKDFVQAGDTITVYGASLQQEALQTELALAGRPSKIVQLGKDSLQAIVPVNTYSGKLMITVSRDNLFASAYGPAVTVAATPVVTDFSPKYAYEGDTIALIGLNFPAEPAQNAVWMDEKTAKVVYSNGKDSLKVIVPAGANTNTFSWRTYNGPVYESTASFPVRKQQYAAATIMDWLRQDPAFSYMHAAFTHSSVKNYMRYDSLAAYLETGRAVSYFFPSNDPWIAQGILTPERMATAVVAPNNYTFVNFPLASILPVSLSPEQLTAGKHETALDENIVFPYDSWRTYRKNYVQLEKIGNDWYVQALTYWGTLGTPLKIQRVHKVGNSYLYELKAPLPYDLDY
ncbi:hypothetical protein [Chitinophaga sp. YIM B06452]|uniref:hypothetical protein n=1 Tax=Chitinophaga sp. YIM B06452 TaxID=3082158 RepID=UPI0031FF0055